MLSYEESRFSRELEHTANEIYNWSLGRERVLNVKSLPYNTCSIFLKVLVKYISENKKVLYITNESEGSIEIINIIKKNSTFRKYTYYRGTNYDKNSNFIICNYNRAREVKEKYDLVIYDDIRSMPKCSKNEIIDIIACNCYANTKIICYSIDEIIPNKREILLPVRDPGIPFPEPRIITTRIDLNRDIPYVIYEYLEWLIKGDRKVMIYVPNHDKANKVYTYIKNYCKKISKNIYCYLSGESNNKLIFNFMKMRSGIIITDDYENNNDNFMCTDIMVFFADNYRFDYKNLIFFCGKVTKGKKNEKGEVIFLAREETEDIILAKDICREFNKEAWERNLIGF